MLLCPALACAAGLGKLKLSSALGEPLNADIELIDATPEELASIVARIGNKNEYASAGLQDSVAPSGIRVNVARNADGQSVLHLMSNRPIDDPFLELLIYMDSDTGHLARQYTLLLDPPVTKVVAVDESPTSPPTNTPPPASTEPLARKEAKVTTRSTHESRPPVRHAKKPLPATDGNAASYTIQPGDILGRVAQRYRPPGTSLHDAITAFHEANPNAFVNGDIDRLKVGQVLKVPTFDGALVAPSQLDESKPAPEAKEKPAVEPKPASANNNSGFVLHIGTEGLPDSDSAETKQSGASTAAAAVKSETDKPNAGLPTAPTAAGLATAAATESQQLPVAAQPVPATPQQMPAVATSTTAPAGESLVDRLMWIGLGVFLALLGMLAMSFYKSRRPRVIRRY